MRMIGALAFPGFELLDLFGPLEMFGILKEDFQIEVVASQPGPIPSNQGPAVQAACATHEQRKYDLILVPGGMGTRSLTPQSDETQWITRHADEAEIIMSVCTGAALLAQAGLLREKRATTNKLAFDWVATNGANTEWIKKARWVEDGNIFTSAGVSAGIDMSLAVIARILGDETAEKTADWAEYNWNRDPNWDPFAGKAGLTD